MDPAGVGALHAAFLNESRRTRMLVTPRAGNPEKGWGTAGPPNCGALEARHYLNLAYRPAALGRCCGIDVPTLPGWADVWLPALRASFRFAVHCRLSHTL